MFNPPNRGEKWLEVGHLPAGCVVELLWAQTYLSNEMQVDHLQELQTWALSETAELWLLLLLLALTAGHGINSQHTGLPLPRQGFAQQPLTTSIHPVPITHAPPSPITPVFFCKSSHYTPLFPTETPTDEHSRGRVCNPQCNVWPFWCLSATPTLEVFCQQAFHLVQLILTNHFWLVERLFKIQAIKPELTTNLMLVS